MQQQSSVKDYVMAAAFRFISYRPRSEKEIRDFLEKKLTSRHTSAPGIVSDVLARLTELGYIDDAKFTQWWISQRTGRKPKGARVIEHELKRRGIDTTVTLDERTLARRAVEKKMKRWAALPALTKKKKLYEYLLRQGFDWETISGIIGEANEKE